MLHLKNAFDLLCLAFWHASQLHLLVITLNILSNLLRFLEQTMTYCRIKLSWFYVFSIGRVNSELYALSAGTWDRQRSSAKDSNSWSDLEVWLLNYANTLCINSWQVTLVISHFLC